jgi:diacylglycerol kinase (ATP)
MTAKVILNPYSNRWRSRDRWPEAEAALRAAGVDFDLSVSQGRGEITRLAAQAVRDGFSPIIVAGGDGSIGETLNGLEQAAGSAKESLVPLGIIPMGTANDLVDNLGLPRDFAEMARVIAAGNVRSLDLCRVNQMVFANNAAIGLEPAVTLIQQEIKSVKGMIRYLLAALIGIARGLKWDVDMEWEGGSYSGPVTLVTVGNCARTGGLFYMTPHADPVDGKLTFVYAYRSSRLQLAAMLPRAMKPGAGSYVEMDGVHEIHSSWLRVHLHTPTPAHADGEIFSTDLTEVEYRISPGRLRLLAPPVS